MDDLISRQAALELVRALPSWPTVLDNLVDRAQVQTELMMLPAAEPRKGKWIDGQCSNCGCDVPAYIIDWKWQKDMDANYCPNCGADMRE